MSGPEEGTRLSPNSVPLRVLATADDFADADGETILTFGQAFETALAWQPGLDVDGEDRCEPITVRRAVERYLEWYKVHRRSYDRMRYNLRAHEEGKVVRLRRKR